MAKLSTPLAGKNGGGKLNLQEVAPQAMINLRGSPTDEVFMQAATTALSCALPTVANTTVRAGDKTILWLGPDEWLIRAPDGQRESLIHAWQQTLATVTAAITDVSDYYTIIRLSGSLARQALAAGCPLDGSNFTAGCCAQSHYAQAAILWHQTDDTPTFELQVRWSYAEYLWGYLQAVSASL